MKRASALLAASLAAWGCSKNEAPPPEPPAPEETAPLASTTSTAETAPPPTTPAPITSESPSPPPQGAPGERSRAPTAAEWDAATEVKVQGSWALGCEAKAAREWVRVSCRGAGAPTRVTLEKGEKPGETFAAASEGAASVVVRFVEGTDVVATFVWDDEKHRLLFRWPRGSRRPAPLGDFEGAPKLEVDRELNAYLCRCSQMLDGKLGKPCDGTGRWLDHFAVECVRGNPQDCMGLVACQSLSPSGHAECLPDEEHHGARCPKCRCARRCGPALPECPAGTECREEAGSTSRLCL